MARNVKVIDGISDINIQPLNFAIIRKGLLVEIPNNLIPA
jgi:hypothetical protein